MSMIQPGNMNSMPPIFMIRMKQETQFINGAFQEKITISFILYQMVRTKS